MGALWSVAVVIGPILLLALIVFAWWKNRQAGRRNLERAERGTRELFDEIEREPNKDVDL